jgi:DNA-binding CsgD family transcriptional regulator
MLCPQRWGVRRMLGQTPPSPAIELPPFIGRQHEMRVLQQHLHRAKQGRGGVILLAGEPGIGKTRLLLEFGMRADDDGWTVLVGRAYDSEGTPPYLLFAEALRAYVRSCPPDTLRAQLGKAAREVGRVVPDVYSKLSETPNNSPTGAEVERYRLFEAISDFLIAIADSPGRHGLVLVLDDLHWADTPSLSFLQHLARRLAGAKMLVAGAYRTVELSRGHPLAIALAELRREDISERMLVPPLSVEDIALLVEAIAGVKPHPGLVETIARQTDGNPFFVRELTQHLKSEGRDLAHPPDATVIWSIPDGVRAVIERRLLRVGAQTNQMLRTAAVLGGGFSWAVLQAMTAIDAEPLLDAIDEAVAAGLVREEGEGYAFEHALIRETIYAGLGLARRKRLHLRAAEVLEAVHTRDINPYLGEIADHYRLCAPLADPKKPVEFARRAGEAAAAVFAYERALIHERTALRLMDQHATPQERIDVLEGLAELCRIMGFDHYSEAIDYWQEALRLCQSSGLIERAARARCRLGALLSASNRTQDIPAAMAHFQAAEEVLAQIPDDASLAYLYRGIGAAANWAAHTADGLLASQRGMELGARVHDEAISITCQVHRGWHLISAGRLAEGLRLMEGAWQKADLLDRTYEAYVATSWRGNRYFLLGDPSAAADCYERELGKKRLAAAPSRHLALVGSLAAAHARTGQIDRAKVLLDQLGSHTFDQDSAMLAQPLFAFWTGDWESATATWSAAQERNRRAGNRWGVADFACWLGHVRHVQGDLAGAADAFDQALAMSLEGPILPTEIKARTGLALLAVESNELAEAQLHARRCAQILAEGEDWRGLAGHVALAEAVSLVAVAEARFADAIRIFRRLRLPWEEAEAWYWWGRALLRAERSDEAHEKLSAAEATYEHYRGGSAWIERVRRARGPELAAEARAGFPDALSEREVQVLRLVAAGKTNRQIAESLFISRNTVERHVNHILAKIGASNRTQLAGYAIRHMIVE